MRNRGERPTATRTRCFILVRVGRGETAQMSHLPPAPPLHDRAALGPDIALDDYGTGTSDSDAMRRLRRIGHRYVAWVRLITLIPTATVCLVLASSASSPV